jgi:uncharacterized protein
VTVLCTAMLCWGGAANVQSYHTLRYRDTTPQTTWATCGPAALSTLLTAYFGQPASEQALATLATQDMQARGQNPADGYTLLALRNVSRLQGVNARGYRWSLTQLTAMLAQGVPVIANLVQPEPHFTVVAAIDQGQVLMNDPSWGFRTMPLAAFLDSWNGIVLVLEPDEVQRLRSQTQVAAIVARHRDVVARLRSGL